MILFALHAKSELAGLAGTHGAGIGSSCLNFLLTARKAGKVGKPLIHFPLQAHTYSRKLEFGTISLGILSLFSVRYKPNTTTI